MLNRAREWHLSKAWGTFGVPLWVSDFIWPERRSSKARGLCSNLLCPAPCMCAAFLCFCLLEAGVWLRGGLCGNASLFTMTAVLDLSRGGACQGLVPSWFREVSGQWARHLVLVLHLLPGWGPRNWGLVSLHLYPGVLNYGTQLVGPAQSLSCWRFQPALLGGLGGPREDDCLRCWAGPRDLEGQGPEIDANCTPPFPA